MPGVCNIEKEYEMKHAPGWILVAFILFLILPVESQAQDEDALILIAAKESRVQAQKWIDFLGQYELPVEHYFLSELEEVKDYDFVVITGGLNETGFKELLKGVIGDSDVASLEAEGAKKMFIKENLWKPGQTVLIFAGSDPALAAEARSESRDNWMELLQDWFDLDEVPGGLKAY